MRRARLTYKGAYHHVMNRGHGGEGIFLDSVAKTHFLDFLERRSVAQRMRIFTGTVGTVLVFLTVGLWVGLWGRCPPTLLRA